MRNESTTGRSYSALLDEVRAQPGSVAVFFDDELSKLLVPLSPDPGIAGPLLGEALARYWLYEDRCPADLLERLESQRTRELLRVFSDEFTSFRRGGGAPDWREVHKRTFPNDILTRAWEFACTRIRSFRQCDGLIAVVSRHMTSQAIAVPFKLQAGTASPEIVRDTAGQNAAKWTEGLTPIRHLFTSPPGVTLDCNLGARSSKVGGGSFALSVLMAERRIEGTEYAPLDLLCTGALDGSGALQDVDGVGAKRRLAQRIGVALFAYPGRGDTPNRELPLATGTPAEDCLDAVRSRLDDLGVTSLSTKEACDKVAELKKDIHEGRISLEKAKTRLRRYQAVFEADQTNDYAQEGMFIAHLLRGCIANHEGNPEFGRHCTRKAASIAQQRNNPRLYLEAAANSVVSLTDLGLLDEAEHLGRDLLVCLDDGFAGSADDKVYARMVANGVLGGQPLLQKALQNPEFKAESLEMLQEALRLARLQQARREIARDISQVALWHALHSPDSADPVIADAEEELLQLGSDGETSLHFLRCSRFLAAYRRLLAGAVDNPPYQDWELPAEPAWVWALSLKYRGALQAARGDTASADADFRRAIRLLSEEPAPLLRFIGGTVALQAGESLRDTDADWRNYLSSATDIFEAMQQSLYGIQQDPGWIERAQGLLSGEAANDLPCPQSYYRY